MLADGHCFSSEAGVFYLLLNLHVNWKHKRTKPRKAKLPLETIQWVLLNQNQ
jgi:hypothetical protein